jgi:tetratricopeptide (TPR) repeat protein
MHFSLMGDCRSALAAMVCAALFAPQECAALQIQPGEPGTFGAQPPEVRVRLPQEVGGASGPVVRGAPENAPESEPAASDSAPQQPAQQEAPDIRTASFQDIVPGQSTLDEVKQSLGEPLSADSDGATVRLEYQRVGPFPKVEVSVAEGVATSIVIHLSRASPPGEVAKELGLHEFRPAAVPEESGRLLGQAYPERGVLFVFAEGHEPPAVSHIVLEPIAAEPFVLRALYDRSHQYRADLADLTYAQRLEPRDPRIFARRAELLAAAGRFNEALEDISKAASLETENLAHRVLAAGIFIEAGRHEQALELVKAIAANDAAPALVRSRAELLWGDILAAGAGGDFQEAIKHHTKAIELAATLGREERAILRREARQLVIEAHLAVARDIACGNWRNKEETVGKWLAQAEKAAEDAITRDNGDPLLRFELQCGTLAALAGAKGRTDPAPIAEAAINTVRQALEANTDPHFRTQLVWQLGLALHDAAVAEQARGNGDSALTYGNQALALLQNAAPERDATDAQHYLLGQVCFRVGSFQAVNKSDHGRAIESYQQALLHFANPLPDCAAQETALHGERYVSMGASYWKSGQQDAGLRLTEQGVQLIEQAVKAGKVRQEILAIPYGNLAAMHRQTGNSKEAEELARMAERLESGGSADSAADSMRR